NHVARIWSPDGYAARPTASRGVSSGIRIKDLTAENFVSTSIGADLLTGQKLRKASGPDLAIGDRSESASRSCVGVLELIEIEKEEGFLFAVVDLRDEHRAAQRKAVLILPDRWPHRSDFAARLQFVVVEILVNLPVVFRGPALGRVLYESAAGVTILSAERVC